jgi:glycosyl transferase family 25
MKAYYINLDRSVGRRDWFERQARRLGIEFERVPAVDAAALTESELARLRSMASVPLSAGEIGCFLSHLDIWKTIAEGGDEWAFVAEDDAHLSADAPSFLSTCDWLPADAVLVKAETTLSQLELSRAVFGRPFGHELRRLKSKHLGSGGYFLSRRGAACLVRLAADRCGPADQFLFSPMVGMLDRHRFLQLLPAICIQDVFIKDSVHNDTLSSVIQEGRHETWGLQKEKQKWKKIARELGRIGQQLKRNVRLAVAMASLQSIVRRVEVAHISSEIDSANIGRDGSYFKKQKV